MDNSTIFDKIEQDINEANISDLEKRKLLENVFQLKGNKVNIMITGATGCGKSSTINAMFNAEVAKVGVGVDPETMDISKYELGNLILWDSPGLGDGKEADNRHAKNIISKLYEKDENNNALIDLVLVILDGSTRDLGTSYELINQVIIPNLGDNKEQRILVAINQCDVAMKGRHWDYDENKPESPLVKFLEEKVESVRRRIKEGTGVDITPIYYSAGFKEEGQEQHPYNLSKLLYFIVKYTPKNKRLVFIDNVNKDKDMWQDDDKLKDYQNEIKKNFFEIIDDKFQEIGYKIRDGADSGGSIGRSIGSIFGSTGEKVGEKVGEAVGGAIGFIKGLFGW